MVKYFQDPEFINKAIANKSNEINTCIACNQACLDHAFKGKVASCLVNPLACHETGISSDNFKFKVPSIRNIEGDYWILNGSKNFITHGISSDIIVVIVRTLLYH